MHRNTAYGVGFQSPFPFPGLKRNTDTDPPDIIVRRETVSSPASESVDSAPRLTIGDEAVYLDYPSVGVFQIREGSEILVDVEPTVDPTVSRFHVLGPALGVALHQRGRLVLHASAVTIDGRAVVFLGETRMGKSTLAAYCADAGHGLLADDLVPVECQDGAFYLSPGFPSVKLDPDTAAALDWPDPKTTSNGKSPVDKAYYPVPSLSDTNRYPIKRIYLLADGDELQLDRLALPEAVAALYRHAYLQELCELTDESGALLEQCGGLAAQTVVKRLSRPRGFGRLPAVVECIEADVRN